MKTKRQTNAQRSLSRVPPSSSEAEVLHSYYLQYGQQNGNRKQNDNLVYMSETRVEKCMLMFPQERNVHQKIFGGYLMRLAYEHVGVTANVVDIKTGSEQTTNDFRFTWCKEDGKETRKVVPRTYQEAMLWLEGRRALEVGEVFRGLRTHQS
ncbi:hypothetical protein V5O48_006499 [Marasmius crinis-equi]|uniref:Uncharacterized protein n=1 Tax=Marasmius crinis-equi TaxID=585013 RepID=A0ABR3FJB9_9AGAR